MVELSILHYQARNSIIHKQKSILKLLFLVVLSPTIMHSSVRANLILFAILIVFFILAQMPWKKQLKSYILASFFLLTISLLRAWSLGPHDLFFISYRGLRLGFHDGFRLFNIILLSQLFIYSSDLIQLLDQLGSVMDMLHLYFLRRIFLTITLTFVLFPLVFDQVKRRFQAMNLRAVHWWKLHKSLFILIVPLLEDFVTRTEKISQSLILRNTNYKNRTIDKITWSRMDLLALTSLALILVLMLVF